jgi:hypothetical protein
MDDNTGWLACFLFCALSALGDESYGVRATLVLREPDGDPGVRGLGQLAKKVLET